MSKIASFASALPCGSTHPPARGARPAGSLLVRSVWLALVGVLVAGAAQAAWWDNRYAVLKADGLATGYATGLSRYMKDGLRTAVGPNNKVGYQDEAGRWVIQPQYVRAYDFLQGRAVVWLDKSQGPFVIDRTGARVGDAPELARVVAFDRDTDDVDLLYYAADRQGQRYSGIMTRDWRSIVEAQDDGRYAARDGQIVQTKDRYTVEKNIDLQGRVLFDKPMAWSTRPATDAIFSRGLALRYVPSNGTYGYIDTTGAWAIEPQYRQATVFGEDGAVVADKEDSDGLYAGRVIDPKGSTLSRLPPATCYSEASRGFLLARVPGPEKYSFEMALMTTQGKIVTRLRIAPSNQACVGRIFWMDDDTLVAGRYWVRKDGTVVHDGLGDVQYDEILAIQPEAGTALVRWENANAPRTLAEHRTQLVALRNSEDGFYGNILLRPFSYGSWDALKAPDFHHYKAVRLYVDDRWPGGSSFDYHLHAMTVEVKVRDGRPAHDNIKVLAEAGCRVPPGWKLLKSDILVVKSSYWFGSEYDDWMDWVRSATGAKNVLWSQNGRKLCEHERLVDGKVERQAKP